MNEINHHKVAIIGAGPAGFTAALYNGRANLAPVVFEGMQPGGQLTITTEVENYPGFEHGIQGPMLMDIMRKQAHRFGAKSIYKEIIEVDFTRRPFILKTYDEVHTADAVIIATGASAKLIGIQSEKDYMGYGVSACATCDGFFFKNQRVLVVGGGDTAMEEANYLTKFASEVYIVHRREEFRASKIMFERAKKNPKIKWLTNKIIHEIHGKQDNGRKLMTGVTLQDTRDLSIEQLEADGLFIAIGHNPNTDIFKGKIRMDEVGYIVVQPGTSYTNIPGIFAAGDVTDKVYRQAVTAAGMGCIAAIDCERWLESEELTLENIDDLQAK
jgi:thioredoxin reductase (NADPH)